jgi:hypothetical protein
MGIHWMHAVMATIVGAAKSFHGGDGMPDKLARCCDCAALMVEL